MFFSRGKEKSSCDEVGNSPLDRDKCVHDGVGGRGGEGFVELGEIAGDAKVQGGAPEGYGSSRRGLARSLVDPSGLQLLGLCVVSPDAGLRALVCDSVRISNVLGLRQWRRCQLSTAEKNEFARTSGQVSVVRAVGADKLTEEREQILLGVVQCSDSERNVIGRRAERDEEPLGNLVVGGREDVKPDSGEGLLDKA